MIRTLSPRWGVPTQACVAALWLMCAFPGLHAQEKANPAPSNPALFEQKAGVVERFLNKSQTSQRGVTATGGAMDTAREKHRLALAAKQEGRLEEALKLLDDSLKLAIQASKASADPASKDWYHKAQYEDLLEAVNNFRATYVRHQPQIQAGGKGGVDLAQVDGLVAQARQAYDEKRFSAARAGVAQAKDLLVGALKGYMDSKTVVYERSFDNPVDAFKHKQDLGNSLETLVRTALAENRVNAEGKEQIKQRAMESRALRDKAMAQSADGDLPAAVATMDQANGLLKEALGLTGTVVPF